MLSLTEPFAPAIGIAFANSSFVGVEIHVRAIRPMCSNFESTATQYVVPAVTLKITYASGQPLGWSSCAATCVSDPSDDPV